MYSKGRRLSEIKKTYIIFICLFDPFKHAYPKYTFVKKCNEVKDLCLNDDSHIIFINPYGQYENVSEELQELLRYLRKDALESLKSSFIRDLDDAVQKVKSSDEWRAEYMNMLLRDKENQRIGFDDGISSVVLKMLKIKMPLSQIEQLSEFSTTKIEEIAKKNGLPLPEK